MSLTRAQSESLVLSSFTRICPHKIWKEKLNLLTLLLFLLASESVMQLQVLTTPKQSHPKAPLRNQDIANRDKRFLWRITYSYGQLPFGRILEHAWGIKLYKLDWIESALLMGQKINQSGWKIYLKWLTGSSCRSQGYLIFVESLKCPKLREWWREIQTTPFTISIWILDIVSSLPKAVSQWEPIAPLLIAKNSLKFE